mmetsp:Transcript_110902/g.313721  ORF Transcript_110902/g.313721 Transcript_110902/m.313721 type:complete len:237 (+) Transcript_110902:613-1323(+)
MWPVASLVGSRTRTGDACLGPCAPCGCALATGVASRRHAAGTSQWGFAMGVLGVAVSGASALQAPAGPRAPASGRGTGDISRLLRMTGVVGRATAGVATSEGLATARGPLATARVGEARRLLAAGERGRSGRMTSASGFDLGSPTSLRSKDMSRSMVGGVRPRSTGDGSPGSGGGTCGRMGGADGPRGSSGGSWGLAAHFRSHAWPRRSLHRIRCLGSRCSSEAMAWQASFENHGG